MSRERVKELSNIFLKQGDYKGWFDALYAEAEGDTSHIPWADVEPTKFLVEWFEKNKIEGDGKRALVVGCGLGDDAEFVASKGFDVTAFDISPSAIDWCKKRFPNTKVNYLKADLFDLPGDWVGNFDLIVEINTLQAMPSPFRIEAMKHFPPLLSTNGKLLVITRGRNKDEVIDGPPWNLSKEELKTFIDEGLQEESFEDFFDDEVVRRFRICFYRDEEIYRNLNWKRTGYYQKYNRVEIDGHYSIYLSELMIFGWINQRYHDLTGIYIEGYEWGEIFYNVLGCQTWEQAGETSEKYQEGLNKIKESYPMFGRLNDIYGKFYFARHEIPLLKEECQISLEKALENQNARLALKKMIIACEEAIKQNKLLLFRG